MFYVLVLWLIATGGEKRLTLKLIICKHPNNNYNCYLNDPIDGRLSC